MRIKNTALFFLLIASFCSYSQSKLPINKLKISFHNYDILEEFKPNMYKLDTLTVETNEKGIVEEFILFKQDKVALYTKIKVKRFKSKYYGTGIEIKYLITSIYKGQVKKSKYFNYIWDKDLPITSFKGKHLINHYIKDNPRNIYILFDGFVSY
jgi:hypothetical protein